MEHGAKVVMCAIGQKDVEKAKKELEKYGEIFAKVADVRDDKEVKKFVNEVLSLYGKIDVLINNAGIIWGGDFSKQSYSSISNLIDSNLKGVLFVTRAVINHMLSRKSGVIINMSSEAGEYGIEGMVTYCATKFGVRGFSEALDEEVSGRGIRVYSICPGAVDTDLQFEFSGKRGGIPPERVAELIVKIAATFPKSKKCFEL